MSANSSTTARRELAAALALLTLATLCCFHQLALHPKELLVGPQKHGHNDLVDYFVPSREFAARSIREGNWPLWNPHICLGLPFTGNAQSALYYPPNWLTLMWEPQFSLSWLLAVHHLFAGLGVYCLSRRRGLSWSASVLGGIVFLGAPFLIAQAAEGHYAQICAVAWIPWAFLAYERFRDLQVTVRRQPLQGAAPGGVTPVVTVLALCFFCGHAQETYYLVLLLTGCLVVDVLACRRAGDRRVAAALCTGWLRCGALTAGVVAIDLAPTFLATLRTARPGLQQHAAGFGWTGLSMDSLRELLDPFALTRPELWQPGSTPFWEKLFHFGVVPLLLAVVGFACAGRRGPARRMAVVWIVTVAFAFGARGAVYDALAAVVPGLQWFREPSRILFFTSFATACLAACGLSVLQRRIAGWTNCAHTCGILSAVVIVVCLGELTRFAHQVTDTATVHSLADRSPALAALLQTAAPGQRVLAPQDVLSDLDALRLRIPKMSGYEPAGPLAYLMVNSQLQGSLPQPPDPMGFLPADPLRMDRRWLELLGIRYAVRAAGTGDVPDGWRRVGEYALSRAVRRRGEALDFPPRTWEVLELTTALPRAFTVGGATPSGRFTRFAEIVGRFDPHHEVALSGDVLPNGPRAEFASAPILNESPTQIEIATALDAPGYLVLSDLWYPGWSATADEQEVAVLLANVAFRAVPLLAGRHRVVLRYQPRGLAMGALLTVAALLVLTRQSCQLIATRIVDGMTTSAPIRPTAAAHLPTPDHENWTRT